MKNPEACKIQQPLVNNLHMILNINVHIVKVLHKDTSFTFKLIYIGSSCRSSGVGRKCRFIYAVPWA